MRSFAEVVAARWARLLLRILVAACLIGLPLLWGGRHVMGVGAAGLAVAAAVLCWAAWRALSGLASTVRCGGLGLLLAVVGVGALQLVPGLWTTGAMDGLWRLAGAEPSAAVLPAYQRTALLSLGTAATFYFLAWQGFGRSRRTLFLLAFAVLAAAASQSLTGLVLRFGAGGSGAVAGTYPNNCHFAQLQEMGLMTGLGLALALRTARRDGSLRRAFGGRWLAAAACGVVLCVMGLLFSVSRGGIMCGCGGVMLFLLYALARGRGHLSWTVLLLTVGIGLVGSYGLDAAVSRMAAAMSGVDESALTRFEIWRTALQVVGLSPWLGSGFGAMRVLSPHFDLSYVPGLMAFNAHNDWIELAAWVGVPCALLVLGGMAWKLLGAVSVLRTRAASVSSYHPVAVGALLGMLSAAAHEFVDYGLKQPANLLAFLALAAVVGGLARRWRDGPPGEPRRDGGRLAYALVPLACAALALPAARCLGHVRAGAALAGFEAGLRAEDAYRGMPTDLRMRVLLRRGGEVLALAPHDVATMYRQAACHRTRADLAYERLLAEELSRILERTVRPSQVWHAPYKPYLRQAHFNIPDAGRETVARHYDRSAECCAGILRENPLSGLALSLRARCLDDAAAMRGDGTCAVGMHEVAQRLYPTHPTVLWNALRGGWRAWQVRPGLRERLAGWMPELARAYGAQLPGRLGAVYPLVWLARPDLGLMERLTPATIAGQEQLASFMLSRGAVDEALAALERAGRMNAARLDVETPDTMGNLAYLRRETRPKAALERALLQRMVPLLEGAGRHGRAAEVRERMAALTAAERTKILAWADLLMDKGEYLMVEELLKPILDDPRALLRHAELLLLESRLENFVRTMRRLERAVLGSGDAGRLAALRRHAAERGVGVGSDARTERRYADDDGRDDGPIENR